MISDRGRRAPSSMRERELTRRLKEERRDRMRELFMVRNLAASGAGSTELRDRLDDMIWRHKNARDD